MITQEELAQYWNVTETFEEHFDKTCKNIFQRLKRYNKKYIPYYNHEFYEFHIYKDSDCVWGSYWISCRGESDEMSESFPKELLFMTDAEIEKWIDDKLEEERLEAERKKQEDELKAKQKAERDTVKKREHDLAEYERIKKEYNL